MINHSLAYFFELDLLLSQTVLKRLVLGDKQLEALLVSVLNSFHLHT